MKSPAEDSGPMGCRLETAGPGPSARRKLDVTHLILRLACLATSVTAVSVMATAEESGTITVAGFNLPIYSKWSFSDSFEYLVGVSAAAAAHSLLQLLVAISRPLRGSSAVPSRNRAWLIFAGDQALAYAMIAAGSASSGVTKLNHAGVRHSAMPNFCKPLRSFCDRVAISIAFTFLSSLFLAASALVDVIWLSKY
ncbi:CASP-like protein 3A1 [Diospyros lotus]|uniref:CASP-like protein 3A1 n=1 Tax=Diospyros lotus TaxID=55363 RepID=UPI00224D053D|nr:CASP-like protein 3A1 [Diospyros lotus]